VYDMYPWDSASRGDGPPRPPRSWGEPSPQTPLGEDKSPQTTLGGDKSPQTTLGGDKPPQTPLALVRAVQVALDRRDNGGDAVAVAGQPTTLPTASRTRQ